MGVRIARLSLRFLCSASPERKRFIDSEAAGFHIAMPERKEFAWAQSERYRQTDNHPVAPFQLRKDRSIFLHR
jgi:hypothetical protein